LPFDLLDVRVGEMTGAELLLLVLRANIAAVAAVYFAVKAFCPPPAHQQNRAFCEWWAAWGLGVLSLIGCAMVAHLVEGEGFVETTARLLGRGVLWLIY